MKRPLQRLAYSAIALSPGVAAAAIQEMAVSMVMVCLGLAGVLLLCLVVLVGSLKLDRGGLAPDARTQVQAFLLRDAALSQMQQDLPDQEHVRAELSDFLTKPAKREAFADRDDQIRMILSQIMSRWQVFEFQDLSDRQVQELWVTDALLRAGPAEAGMLAAYFRSPEALLSMRDRINQRAGGELANRPAFG